MGIPGTHRIALAATAAALVTLGLSGCATGSAMPVPTYIPTPTDTPAPTDTASPIPDAGPVLRPGRSAAANQQYFDTVNAAFYAAHGKSDGRSIIDNLVAAGFRKQDMEVTPDNTKVTTADSIIFSVRIKGECLVGQFGVSGYRGIIGPLLGTGSCLIGITRPIDW